MSEQLWWVERYFPINGPCLMCGSPGFSARHRTLDAIRERVKAGETVDEVADDYGLPAQVVVELCALRTSAFGRLRRMPMDQWQTRIDQWRIDQWEARQRGR